MVFEAIYVDIFDLFWLRAEDNGKRARVITDYIVLHSFVIIFLLQLIFPQCTQWTY